MTTPTPDGPADPAPTTSQPTLELEIAPGEVRRLLRHPVLAGGRRAGRGKPVVLAWHGALDNGIPARLGCRTGAGWEAQQVRAEPGHPFPPGSAPVVLRSVAVQAGPVDAASLPEIGRFEGTVRTAEAADGRITVLAGTFAGPGGAVSTCRVQLQGFGYAAVRDLAAALPLRVPPAGLALAAVAAGTGGAPAPPPLGAPEIRSGTVADTVAAVVAHLAGVVLHWAALVGTEADADGTAVHQMRVGVRRLRSALWVFRDPAGSHAAAELTDLLRDAFGRLGAVRDWDVFLCETGPAIAGAMPDDPRVPALLQRAEQQQHAARAGLHAWLHSPAWRRTSVALAAFAVLRPWAEPTSPEQRQILLRPSTDYAHDMLRRLRRKLLAQAEDVEALPPDLLHELRKRGKRARYAAEFFAPLFKGKPTRRFLRRLEHAQAVMGTLNDASVAENLMRSLAREHPWAAGVVQGWSAAHRQQARDELAESWKRLRRAEPFW